MTILLLAGWLYDYYAQLTLQCFFLLQLVVNVFGVLLQRFRESLKPEIGVFFSLIVLQSLDNVENPLIHSPPVLK
jgi:hypothetical protein